MVRFSIRWPRHCGRTSAAPRSCRRAWGHTSSARVRTRVTVGVNLDLSTSSLVIRPATAYHRESMRVRSKVRRARLHAVVGVAIYALFLFTAPFEHHDLQCELKTPTHCTACTSSVVSTDPHALVAVGATDLADAGGALAADAT